MTHSGLVHCSGTIAARSENGLRERLCIVVVLYADAGDVLVTVKLGISVWMLVQPPHTSQRHQPTRFFIAAEAGEFTHFRIEDAAVEFDARALDTRSAFLLVGLTARLATRLIVRW